MEHTHTQKPLMSLLEGACTGLGKSVCKERQDDGTSSFQKLPSACSPGLIWLCHTQMTGLKELAESYVDDVIHAAHGSHRDL